MLLEIIVNIQNNKTKLVAYDLSAVVGCISEKKIKKWSDNLKKLGSKFDYHAQTHKSWLTVKEKKLKTARTMFSYTKRIIATDGKKTKIKESSAPK